MKRELVFALTSIAVFCSGCAVIESHPAKTKSQGLAYSLPKGRVLLTAQRTVITADAAAAAQKAATESATQLAAAQKNLADAKAKPGSSDDTVIAGLAAKVATAQAAAKAATTAANDAAAAVGGVLESATLTVLPVVPDPKPEYRYVADLSHAWTRDDDIKITVSNGLLASSDVTAVDQSANIVVQLASDVVAFTGIPAGPPAVETFKTILKPESQEELPPTTTCPSYEFSAIFDPTVDTEDAVNRALSKKSVATVLSVHFANDLSEKIQQPADSGKETTGGSGLFYRSPISVIVNIDVDQQKAQSKCAMKTLPKAQSIVAVVPDANRTFQLPVKSSAFVTATENFAFKDGMPTSYTNKRNSEVLAVLGIPVDIAKAIVAVPAQLIQARVNYDSQATAQVNAQVESLKAQLNAIQAQKQLDAAKASSSP